MNDPVDLNAALRQAVADEHAIAEKALDSFAAIDAVVVKLSALADQLKTILDAVHLKWPIA